ncbi:hypothetical protein FA15DRAFT_693414 [Coprinopsis marcescibilis]|nr:hypothetical protein FA15DRAFT_693414 [Coprinopsis marcescibilis]
MVLSLRKGIVWSTILGGVYAINDWRKPCISGVCHYELTGKTVGTMKIWGDSDAITDITGAAGWEILDCQQKAISQEIRLVCANGDLNCDHLGSTDDAVGKVVRLPEHCGVNGFAHISRSWVSEDQSIPEHIAKRLVKRNGVEPQVRALHVSTDFSTVDASSKAGAVRFEIVARNTDNNDDEDPCPSTDDDDDESIEKRNFVFKKAEFGHKNSSSSNPDDKDKDDGTTNGRGRVKVKFDRCRTLKPFVVDQNFTVFDESISCGPAEAGLTVNAEVKANILSKLTVTLNGTLVPPNIEHFSLKTNLDGNISGALRLESSLNGELDSGKIAIMPAIGVPGLVIPNILEIGPTLTLDVRAIAKLGVRAGITLGFNYSINNATLLFGNTTGTNGSDDDFKFEDTPLQLAVLEDPTVEANGSLEAHLIPSLNLGIDAFDGKAKARIFFEIDTSAKAEVEVGFKFKTGAGPSANRSHRERAHSRDLESRSLVGSEKREFTDFGGCYNIVAGIDVSTGADAGFFDLFEEQAAVSLFNREFQLTGECFGSRKGEDALAKRSLDLGATPTLLPRTNDAPEPTSTSDDKDKGGDSSGLSCPKDSKDKDGDSGEPISLLDMVVQAAEVATTERR